MSSVLLEVGFAMGSPQGAVRWMKVSPGVEMGPESGGRNLLVLLGQILWGMWIRCSGPHFGGPGGQPSSSGMPGGGGDVRGRGG